MCATWGETTPSRDRRARLRGSSQTLRSTCKCFEAPIGYRSVSFWPRCAPVHRAAEAEESSMVGGLPGAMPTLDWQDDVFILDLGNTENRFHPDWLASLNS